MRSIEDWLGNRVDVATSNGGVLAVADPWNNVVRSGVHPWPPPELIQKIYESRQAQAYSESERAIATSKLGFYSDLQSLHSEDAITWSVFGPVVYAAPSVRSAFVKELLVLIDIQAVSEDARLWLWRRLPHPDNLVPGGPEIDFGVQTGDMLLLGEAKWRSSFGVAQGVNRNKTQMELRQEFCQKYGSRLLPGVRHFVVLAVSWRGNIAPCADTEVGRIALHVRDTTWDALAGIRSHPCSDELQECLRWKVRNSKAD